MRVAVQGIHTCGHDATYTVEPPSAKNTRSFYTELFARPCPRCEKPNKRGGKKR